MYYSIFYLNEVQFKRTIHVYSIQMIVAFKTNGEENKFKQLS